MPWDTLPTDIVLLILEWRSRLRFRDFLYRTAQRFQGTWRGYRVRILLGRFRMLRYLKAFREWNPDLMTFLLRARL